jgi:hypothetical protein
MTGRPSHRPFSLIHHKEQIQIRSAPDHGGPGERNRNFSASGPAVRLNPAKAADGACRKTLMGKQVVSRGGRFYDKVIPVFPRPENARDNRGGLETRRAMKRIQGGNLEEPAVSRGGEAASRDRKA